MTAAVLQVMVRHERDVPGAVGGGADRLHVAAEGELSPEPAVLSAICRASEVPVFVTVRLNDSWTTTGGELTRLIGLAEDYLRLGAAGLSFGFLDTDLEVDVEVCAHLADALPGVPWTFHAAIDAALDQQRSWRHLVTLPGLSGVIAAGSTSGSETGYDELLTLAGSDPRIARLLLPGAGLQAEQVPWLLRAGVRQFHLGLQARPGATYRSYVEAGHVRSWRLLLDAALERH